MSEVINTDKELKAEEAPADEAKKKHRAGRSSAMVRLC